eukprot:12575518-Alexandrium_andersonii.AAC.1
MLGRGSFLEEVSPKQLPASRYRGRTPGLVLRFMLFLGGRGEGLTRSAESSRRPKPDPLKFA